MKFVKRLSLIFVVLFTAQIAFAQTDDEPCKLMLQNGLYKTFKIERKGTFEQDLKTYLSTTTFKNDYRNRQWGGELNVLIPQQAGPPVPVGLKANSSDQDVDTFQQKIINATSLKVDQSFYDFASSSIPDVDLAEKYTNCLIGTRKFGFKPFVDIGESEVTFSISYKKEFETDAMPTVKNFAVINGEVLSGVIAPGKVLGNNNTIIVRRLPDKDLVFVLDTDKGAFSQRIPGMSAGFNKDLPIGTIIASYLTFEQFNAVTSNNTNCPNNVWLARCSKWSPADGRSVVGSKLADFPLPLQGIVPDLRGVFLRGLNQFDPNSPVAQDSSRNDPDKNRNLAGSYQRDEFQGHRHNYEIGSNTPDTVSDGAFKAGTGIDRYNGGRIQGPVELKGNDTPRFGVETRPKNVAVYYYIRIN
jgi:hypothetical protein